MSLPRVLPLRTPPIRVVSPHPVARVAVDGRLDVGDAEVAQGCGVDPAQEPQGLALPPPREETRNKVLYQRLRLRCSLGPSREGRQRELPSILTRQIHQGHDWPPSKK